MKPKEKLVVKSKIINLNQRLICSFACCHSKT